MVNDKEMVQVSIQEIFVIVIVIVVVFVFVVKPLPARPARPLRASLSQKFYGVCKPHMSCLVVQRE